MTYISKNMQLNLNYKYRRYNGSSKSWCRVPAMARSFGTPFYHLNKTQKSFYTDSARKNFKVIYQKGGKVFYRKLRNISESRTFMKTLSKRFNARFKKRVNFKILNLARTKFIYWTGEKTINYAGKKIGQ